MVTAEYPTRLLFCICDQGVACRQSQLHYPHWRMDLLSGIFFFCSQGPKFGPIPNGI